MIGIDPAQNPNSTVYNGSQRPGSRVPSQAEVRNFAWYEAKKREMGVKKFYRDTAVLGQRNRDLEAQGDAFYN